MPRFELPSKQADGTANWVEVADPDDLMAETLMAIHRAVRITSGANGETSYSPKEMEDDSASAFLGFAITAWSFPAPIPSQNNLVAADRAIGKVMKSKDFSSLKIQVKPLMDELEGVERDDPKPPPSS
jgi:hypothetical protein